MADTMIHPGAAADPAVAAAAAPDGQDVGTDDARGDASVPAPAVAPAPVPTLPDDSLAAHRDKTEERGCAAAVIGTIAVVVVSAVSGLFATLDGSEIDLGTQKLLKGLVVATIALVVLVGIVVAFRRKMVVRRTLAMVSLVSAVGIVALAPVLVLAIPDRVFLLKLGAILVFSVYPGGLYIQFVASRGRTLREEYVKNLTRLLIDHKSELPTAEEAAGAAPSRNLYLRKFQAQYGSTTVADATGTHSALQREGLFPVVLTTILLAVGWTLVLRPEQALGYSWLPSDFQLSNVPALPADAMAFAFLGSYFFVVQMLSRRYFQDDLRTSAYVSASVRLLSVMVLVPVVDTVWPADAQAQEAAFVFLIGVMPQIALRALRNLIAVPFRRLVPSIESAYPLSDLDGLSFWYEARLLEEGIEDMQNLASSSFVDIMLHTRVPVDRLVDWIDQAQLYLRVPRDQKIEGTEILCRDELRRFGVRTATDLEHALHRATERPGGRDRCRFEQVLWILNPRGENGRSALPSITASIADSFLNAPNLVHVRSWKLYWQGLAGSTENDSLENPGIRHDCGDAAPIIDLVAVEAPPTSTAPPAPPPPAISEDPPPAPPAPSTTPAPSDVAPH